MDVIDSSETASKAADTSWQDRSACRDVGIATNVHFSENLREIIVAKQICADCPVLSECLQGALERKEPWGVWGGQSFRNGRIVHQKRGRGRPPKVVRPENIVPKVPVPAHLQALASAL